MDKQKIAKDLRERHYTMREIANRVGVDQRTVYRWFEAEREYKEPKDAPQMWQLEGDFTVIGDVHVDAVNWDYTSLVFKQAKDIKTPRLIIAGDLFSFHRLGRYPIVFKVPSTRDEIQAAKKYIAQAMRQFEEVYWFVGNHDERFIAAMDGTLEIEDMADLICANGNRSRLFTSPYNYCHVDNAGMPWHITHTYEYNPNPLVVAKKYAAFNEMNVIHQHKHIANIGVTDNHKYIVIDNGCMCEQGDTGYAHLRDGTMPRFQKSAVFLKSGEPLHFSDDCRVFSFGPKKVWKP